jgi:hypothetical protein
VTARKPFLLRLDPATFEALQAWAADDLRSVNGQVEFLLRRSLREAGRLRSADRAGSGGTHSTGDDGPKTASSGARASETEIQD